MQIPTLGQRLRFFIKTNGLNIKEFAEVTSINYRTLQRYLEDSREPGSDAFKKMCDRFDVSIDWLVTGEGQMNRRPINGESELVHLISQLSQSQRSEIQERVTEMIRLNQLSDIEERLKKLEEQIANNVS